MRALLCGYYLQTPLAVYQRMATLSNPNDEQYNGWHWKSVRADLEECQSYESLGLGLIKTAP